MSRRIWAASSPAASASPSSSCPIRIRARSPTRRRAARGTWDSSAPSRSARTRSISPRHTWRSRRRISSPGNSKIQSVEDVDREGHAHRGAGRAPTSSTSPATSRRRSWCTKKAPTTHSSASSTTSSTRSAGLRPRLVTDQENLPGSRILDGHFTAVQQAAGTPKGRSARRAVPARVHRGRESERPRREDDREQQRAGTARSPPRLTVAGAPARAHRPPG